MQKAIKVSSELAKAAGAEAKIMSRSMSKQLEHWALLGRSLERSGAFSYTQITAFLEGRTNYDGLTGVEQAVAAERLIEELEGFEAPDAFFDELNSGIGYSGIDSGGEAVRRKR